MSESDHEERLLDRRQPLLESRAQPTSMSLPAAVHYRLGRLAELAAAAKASRAEIVAMLITEADLDARSLSRRILDYRELTVADVVDPLALPQADPDRVVVPIVRPGRPRRRPRA